ncbi:hypothetical protein IAQ61_009358 [Plenodomus lingam]|uniref:uncharacterized protein n=1 Tax=Leptosphaeria maculans TaxID=5022 RepID=UPI003317605D|nr:hypothetical protein IAQ61_009358 [Plenodomus lingam]
MPQRPPTTQIRGIRGLGWSGAVGYVCSALGTIEEVAVVLWRKVFAAVFFSTVRTGPGQLGPGWLLRLDAGLDWTGLDWTGRVLSCVGCIVLYNGERKYREWMTTHGHSATKLYPRASASATGILT